MWSLGEQLQKNDKPPYINVDNPLPPLYLLPVM